jgi:membrane fusion protein (multidrug efflux system)
MDAQVSAVPEPTTTSRRKQALRLGLLTLAVVGGVWYASHWWLVAGLSKTPMTPTWVQT